MFPDVCLSRGTKRKLTQRTLLQLNFSPISKVQNFPGDSLKSDNNAVLRDCNNHVLWNSSSALPAFAAEEESENKYEVTQNLDHNHKSSCKISSSSLPSKNELPKWELTNFRASIAEVTLETFIVGRRYTDHEEIHPGATISLLRDPYNVQDSNAIKVFIAFRFYLLVLLLYIIIIRELSSSLCSGCFRRFWKL